MEPFAFLAAPAQRALHNAGIHRLEDLSLVTEERLLSLHGMGPNALRKLKEEMGRRGLSFARP